MMTDFTFPIINLNKWLKGYKFPVQTLIMGKKRVYVRKHTVEGYYKEVKTKKK